MKKLFSNFACAALVAAGMMSASGAQAQLYVTGADVDGQTSEWNPSAPLVVELQDGYYTFQATGEFKMSTVMGDWDAFDGGALRPSAWTLDGNVATATLSNGSANVKAPTAWATSKVTYKVDEAYGTVTATVGEVEKIAFYVTGSPFPGGWGAFNDAVKMTEVSENVFTYVAENGITGSWKISAKGYSPNFGSNGSQPVLNELYELADNGVDLNTAFQGKCTITFTYNPDGVSTLFVTSDAQQEIDYTTWYLNIVGDFNSWADNGVSFDAEGIARRENVAVGNGGFKIKVWNGAADMWHCSGEALPLDAWTAVVGNSDQLMTVEGAEEGDLYNFEYNAKTDEVYVSKVGGDDPEPPVENVAIFNFAAPTTLDPSFPDWTETFTEPWVADGSNGNTMIDLADVVLTNNGVELTDVVNEGVTNFTAWRIYRQASGVQELRWYKNTYLRVSSPSGYYVQSVEFYSPRTTSQSKLGNVAVGASDGAKLTAVETLPEGMGCGVVYNNADESVVSQSFFVTATTSAQLIKVYYEAVSTTGVDRVEAAEAAEAVYYNLQGVRVANPENGLYIRVQGKTVSKVYVK